MVLSEQLKTLKTDWNPMVQFIFGAVWLFKQALATFLWQQLETLDLTELRVVRVQNRRTYHGLLAVCHCPVLLKPLCQTVNQKSDRVIVLHFTSRSQNKSYCSSSHTTTISEIISVYIRVPENPYHISIHVHWACSANRKQSDAWKRDCSSHNPPR